MRLKSATLAGLIAAAAMISGCTDETGDEADGHLLEAQQEALERARNVEDDIAEAAAQRDRQIDQNEQDP